MKRIEDSMHQGLDMVIQFGKTSYKMIKNKLDPNTYTVLEFNLNGREEHELFPKAVNLVKTWSKGQNTEHFYIEGTKSKFKFVTQVKHQKPEIKSLDDITVLKKAQEALLFNNKFATCESNSNPFAFIDNDANYEGDEESFEEELLEIVTIGTDSTVI